MVLSFSTVSDSTSTTTPQANPPAKSPPLRRLGSGASVVTEADLITNCTVEAEVSCSKKLPSSKYKGVVPQPNGRWGAQIYEKHQRVWLGTFNEESEAAKAYDTAVRRFRHRDAVTNFKIPDEDDHSKAEAMFLNSHSKAEIVDMLRKHTYQDEFEQSKKKLYASYKSLTKEGLCNISETNAIDHLFEKIVTPSDVGKLNRLVIPKQHAEKHFPLEDYGSQKASNKGVLLNFEDRSGKVWRFRYSYWNSSQSYVFTKGWSRFVKEKNLRAGDIVSFHRSTNQDNKQLYIDWKTKNGHTNNNIYNNKVLEKIHVQKPVVRLFGVNISEVQSDQVSSCGVKRPMREMGMLESLQCSKKLRVISNVL